MLRLLDFQYAATCNFSILVYIYTLFIYLLQRFAKNVLNITAGIQKHKIPFCTTKK